MVVTLPSIPCKGRSEQWEDPHYRFQAMKECRACPVLQECRENYLPLLEEVNAQCVAGGVSLFHRYNNGEYVVHRTEVTRWRLVCKEHHFTTSSPDYEALMELAARHSLTLERPGSVPKGKERDKPVVPKGANLANCVICNKKLNKGRRGKRYCGAKCKSVDYRKNHPSTSDLHS